MADKNLWLILLGLLFVSGLIAVGVTQFSIIDINVYNPPPLPTEKRLVQPLYGTMSCKYTNEPYEFASGAMVKCTETVCGGDYDANLFESQTGKYVRYQFFSCPADVGTGNCQFKIQDIQCAYTPRYARSFITDWRNGIILGDGQVFEVSAGQSGYLVAVACVNDYGAKYPITANWYASYNERAIWIEGADIVRGGWLAGTSPDCRWTSTTALQNIINRQPTSEPLVVTSNLKLSESKNFVAGYDDFPDININPFGKFDNKDVYCEFSASTGGVRLWSVNPLKTVGGKEYYIAGSLLASGVDYCCDTGQATCSDGFVCEDYRCTKQATCELGTCRDYQKGEVIDEFCERRNGQYVNVIQSCGNDLCVYEITKNVACCLDSCGAGYTCDFQNGCVREPQQKDECPDGYCCNNDHNLYKAGACAIGLQCCWADDSFNDPNMGICKDACGVPVEICDDNIDNDGDGLIDDRDPDCQDDCELRCAAMSDLNPFKQLCYLNCQIPNIVTNVLNVLGGILIAGGIFFGVLILIVIVVAIVRLTRK